MRPAAGRRNGCRTRDRPVGADRAVRDQLHRPVRRTAGCSARSPGGPARPSPAGWMTAARTGRTRSRSWPSTRARSTGPRSPGRCRTRSSSSITSTWSGWPTRPSPGSGSGSPARSWAAAAPPGTRPGPTGGGCCAAASGSPSSAFTRMWDEILAQEATGELLAAWIAKEELRYLLALARTQPGPVRGQQPAVRVLRLVRPRRRPRGHHPGPHHRGLVAADPRLPRHRHHQRRHRGEQPAHQRRRPHRVRVPQPRQPAPPSTVALQTDDDQLSRCEGDQPPQVRRAHLVSSLFSELVRDGAGSGSAGRGPGAGGARRTSAGGGWPGGLAGTRSRAGGGSRSRSGTSSAGHRCR